MDKPDLLRAYLGASIPEFLTDPDRMAVFVDKGRLVSRRSASLSYEYRYELTLWLEAFTRGPDAVMVPLLLWLRTHQPELLLRFEREDDAIVFAADILDQGSWNILIRFELTEAVTLVARGDGSGWDVTHLPEPSADDLLLDGANIDVPLAEIWMDGARLVPT